MINATVFFNENVEKQREIIDTMIAKQQASGDPVIKLPFDTYPIVEEEMKENGWKWQSYRDETGKQCALFYPIQYEYSKKD